MIGGEDMLAESRVYGGGLRKLEPRELAKVPAVSVAEVLDHQFLGPPDRGDTARANSQADLLA
jgi:hypothetical protein